MTDQLQMEPRSNEGPPPVEPISRELSDYQVFHDLKDVSALSVEEIDREIVKLRNGEALNDRNHRWHDGALDRLNALSARKYDKTPEEKEAEVQKEVEAWREGVKADGQRRAEEKAEEEFQRTEGYLKALWGNSNYEKNLSLAKKVVANFADDEQMDFIEESGLGNDVEFISLVHRLGEMLEAKGVKKS